MLCGLSEKLKKAVTVYFKKKAPCAEGGDKVEGNVDPRFAAEVYLSRCPHS